MAKIEKGRFAIVIKESGEVSEIKRFEGGQRPEIAHPELYDVVEVASDVQIGMVRQGGAFAFAYNRPSLQAAAPADAVAQDGVGSDDVTAPGQTGEQASAFQGMDAVALKAFIKDKTGSAPKGNPSLETLLRLAEEAAAGQKASG